MFKRLKERLAEEANKFPVGQHAFGNNPGKSPDANTNYFDKYPINSSMDNTEDLITLSESSAVIVPHSSSEYFSIADEDDSLSDCSSPQKKGTHISAGSKLHSTADNECPTNANYIPAQNSSFVSQTDIESEIEEPPTLTLEDISKEQLLSKISVLQTKVAKVVQAYKGVKEEKKKLEYALTQNQDRSLRRVAELREQCNLEQRAKAHLEDNLRLILDEKESRISVLETQVILLKEGHSEIDNTRENENKCVSSSTMTDEKELSCGAVDALLDKECQINLIAMPLEMTELSEVNVALQEKLEVLTKSYEALKEKESKLHDCLDELKRQQEDSAMAMAEKKKRLHEDLDLKDRQIHSLKEDARQLQLAIDHEMSLNTAMKMQHKTEIKHLQIQLETMEEDKQSLVRVSQGKSDAIALMQQENKKKIVAVEEEWKAKLEKLELQQEVNKKIKKLEEELIKERELRESECKSLHEQMEKKDCVLKQMEDDQRNFKELIDELLLDEKTETDQASDCTSVCLNTEFNTKIDNCKYVIAQLRTQKEVLAANCTQRIAALNDEFKIQLDQQEAEFLSKLKTKEDELHKVEMSLEKQELSTVELDKSKDEISRLRKYIDSLKIAQLAEIEKKNKEVENLEQGIIAATESKYQHEIDELKQLIQKLQAENRAAECLAQEQSKLEIKVNESLSIATEKQRDMQLQMTNTKKSIQETMEKLKNVENECVSLTLELGHKNIMIDDLKSNILQKDEELSDLKLETTKLIEIGESSEMKIQHLEEIQDCLKAENTQLRTDLSCMVIQKHEENEQCSNSPSQELNMKGDGEKVMFIDEHMDLRMNGLVDDNENRTSMLICENQSLRKKIQNLEAEVENYKAKHILNESDNVKQIQQKYEEQLQLQQNEMESKLQQLEKELVSQIHKTKHSDLQVEKYKDFADKLQRENMLEMAELTRGTSEKELAIDDIREHYEVIIQEKNLMIKELESKSATELSAVIGENSETLCSEPSDWDDTWVVPEETCENSSSVTNVCSPCEQHLRQIEFMQEELAKCNATIEEFRILLRLSSPQSLTSNTNYFTSSSPLPEPTEIEYLKNILFEYMMGKETETLVKVIAAVLKFNEEQTKMVIDKEKTKQLTNSMWLNLSWA